MDEVSIDDLRTFFVGTVILYKGKPCKVRSINENKVYRITNLATGRTASVENAHRDILPPSRRLGMVNICDSTMYVSRVPYRKFQIGICNANVSIRALQGAPYPEGELHTKALLGTFESPCIADCLIGKYPSFEEALKQAEQTEGACAFDKQFAVDSCRRVYYRSQRVGHVPVMKNPTVDDIAFERDQKHLSFLLGEPYAKDFSNLGQAFA